jgi:hypothetical protein
VSGRRFSQPGVVTWLCFSLAKLTDAPALTAPLLADAVAPRFPDVPLPVLRLFAAKVLRLHFEPVEIPDIERDLPDRGDQIIACEFFGAACAAEADSLRDEMLRRGGLNVVSLHSGNDERGAP